jgi:hypothetical protein
MAWAPEKTANRTPALLRYTQKSRVDFVCGDCYRERHGWSYAVGFDPFRKREVCGECWASPRIPPMKPIGYGYTYG